MATCNLAPKAKVLRVVKTLVKKKEDILVTFRFDFTILASHLPSENVAQQSPHPTREGFERKEMVD